MNTGLALHRSLANEFSRAWELQIMYSHILSSGLTDAQPISMVITSAEAKNVQKNYSYFLASVGADLRRGANAILL